MVPQDDNQNDLEPEISDSNGLLQEFFERLKNFKEEIIGKSFDSLVGPRTRCLPSDPAADRQSQGPLPCHSHLGRAPMQAHSRP